MNDRTAGMHMHLQGTPFDIGSEATSRLLGPIFSRIYEGITNEEHREQAAAGAFVAMLTIHAGFAGHKTALSAMERIRLASQDVPVQAFEDLRKQLSEAAAKEPESQPQPEPVKVSATWPPEVDKSAERVCGDGLSEEDKRRVAAVVMAAGLDEKPGVLVDNGAAVYTGSAYDIATQMHRTRMYQAMESVVDNMPPETHKQLLQGFVASVVAHFCGPDRPMLIADASTELRKIAMAIDVAGAELQQPRR